MIARPVKVESDNASFWLVDASGRIIADQITREDDALEITRCLNICAADTHHNLSAVEKVKE